MEERNKIEVTNNNGDKMSLEVSWDADLDTYLDSFKAILKWLSFPDELTNALTLEHE